MAACMTVQQQGPAAWGSQVELPQTGATSYFSVNLLAAPLCSSRDLRHEVLDLSCHLVLASCQLCSGILSWKSLLLHSHPAVLLAPLSRIV